MRYGKIVDGEIDLATYVMYDEKKGGCYHPTDEEYKAMGFKPLVGYYDVSSEDFEDDGMVHELVGLEETTLDGEDVIVCTYNVFDPKLGHRVFSKHHLELTLFNLGLMEQVDAFIDSQSITNEHGQTMTLRRMYNTALTFSEDNEYFGQFKSALQQQLGVSDEQVEAILASSVAKSDAV